MSKQITSFQAMSHPTVVENINSLAEMADELRAALAKAEQERDTIKDLHARLVKMVDDGSIHGRLYSAGLESERQIVALEKERDALQKEQDINEQHYMSELFDLTAERDALRADAQRYRWLTADLDTANGRIKRNEILEQMSVMSYSAACMNIDAAMKGQR